MFRGANPRRYRRLRNMTKKQPPILIGTSGWSYASWRGPFFPTPVMVKHHLAYYATQFPTTELNGIFYRTPSFEAVQDWHDRTPDDFVFAWKASKFITHWKRPGDTSHNSLDLIEERLAILGRKAGPVLFQLPPQFKADKKRLASFIKLLSGRRRYVFNFATRAGMLTRFCARKRDRPVHFGPSRCSGAMGVNRSPRLYSRTWSGWRL
jgi:uncharacterized protein YecE (DUF72 family)